MISKSVLIMGFGLAKAKSQQAESHLLYPLCTIIDQNYVLDQKGEQQSLLLYGHMGIRP